MQSKQNKQVVQKRLVSYGLLLVIVLGLSGCVLPTPPAATPEASTPAATPDATAAVGATTTLENTSWRLVSFGAPDAETPVVADSTVTLEFSATGEVGGSGGCNTYGGTYVVQDNQLVISEVVSTLMACADQQVTDQEMEYLTALSAASRFELNAETLRIWYDNENSVLIFAQE